MSFSKHLHARARAITSGRRQDLSPSIIQTTTASTPPSHSVSTTTHNVPLPRHCCTPSTPPSNQAFRTAHSSQFARMSTMQASHGHSEACCNIPPVQAKGYDAKGSYEELGGFKTCKTLCRVHHSCDRRLMHNRRHGTQGCQQGYPEHLRYLRLLPSDSPGRGHPRHFGRQAEVPGLHARLVQGRALPN